MRHPSDNVRRQNQITSNDDILSEDERMEPGVPQPVLHETNRIAVAKWKIKNAYYYLMFTSVLCTVAIIISPSDNVRLVALAIWASAAADGGALRR